MPHFCRVALTTLITAKPKTHLQHRSSKQTRTQLVDDEHGPNYDAGHGGTRLESRVAR